MSKLNELIQEERRLDRLSQKRLPEYALKGIKRQLKVIRKAIKIRKIKDKRK